MTLILNIYESNIIFIYVYVKLYIYLCDSVCIIIVLSHNVIFDSSCGLSQQLALLSAVCQLRAARRLRRQQLLTRKVRLPGEAG